MKFSRIQSAVLGLLLGAMLPGLSGAEPPVLKFREVYDLVRSNLTGISEADLDRTAALGFIKELGPSVQLVQEGSEPTNAPIKSAIYNNTFAFIRLQQITAATPAAFESSYKALASSNRLRGLVLDLRYADGKDYNAAAKVADRFLKKEEPLLKWGQTTVNSTAKTNAIEVPVAILVNQQTSGGAEVVAALLREKEAGLVIGSPTSGHTRVFEIFALSGGQQIRIGTTQVELASGKGVSPQGITPDLAVTVEPANEKVWYEDPFKPISRVFRENATNETTSFAAASRLVRRMNEAELVRRHREGADSDPDPRPSEEMARQVITDPVLARGLDFLKGVSVLQGLH